MKITRVTALAVSLLWGVKALAGQSQAYDFKIVAWSGNIAGFPVANFKQTVALNDNGYVAFIAVGDYGSKAVFLAEPSGNGHLLHKLAETSPGDYGGVSLNNQNHVSVSFRATASGVTSANVRRYEPTGAGGAYNPVDIVKATTARYTVTIDPCLPSGGSCPFTYRFRKEAYDNILNQISMDESGKVALIGEVFSDLGQASYYLTTQSLYSGGNEPEDVVPYQFFSSRPDFKPVIADSGHVLARVGGQGDSPILLYGPSFSSIEAIAGSANFSRIGLSPGVSEDGQVVAFYGNLTEAGASALNTAQRDAEGGLDYPSGPLTDATRVAVAPLTAGEGIFVSIGTAARRVVQRIAATSSGGFSGFDADTRVAVSSLSVTRHHLTVAYTATKSAKRGLYTQRVNCLFPPPGAGTSVNLRQPADFLVTQPIAVVQKDDTIFQDENGNSAPDVGEPKLSGIVSDLAINEAVNNHGLGEVAFWVRTDTGTEAIIKAVPWFDSPFVDRVILTHSQPDRGSGNTAPNYQINQIILHASVGTEAALVATARAQNSAHYGVSRQGRITQFIKEAKQADHARKMAFQNAFGAAHPQVQLVNDWSVGIELVDDCVDVEAPIGICDCSGGHTGPASVWATADLRRKAALLVRDIGTRQRVPLKHLIPSPRDLADHQDNGNRRYTVPFVLPSLRPGLFAVSDADGDGQPDFEDGNDLGVEPDVRDGFDYDVKGVLSHGQVIDRTSGKTDPKSFDWTDFMLRANSGVGLALHSPANLLVTDPEGRRTGYDAVSGQTLLEIPGSQFTGAGTEPQSLSIPDGMNGDYTIQVVGTSNGVYRLDVYASGQDAGLTQSQIAGTTALGQTATYTLNHDAVSGDATTITGSGNLPPVAFPDFATTVSNTPAAIAVLDNDNDPEGFLNTNSVIVVTNPAAGLVSVNPTNGVITYTPVPGFLGTNTFAYTVQDNQGALSAPGVVTVIVTEPVLTTNRPPIAVNDSASTTNGVPVTIDVLANDSAPDGTLDPSTVTITRAPTNGTASVDAYTGAITYTPNAGTTNPASLAYTVRDDLGTLSAEATVTVTNYGPPPMLNSTLPPYLVGEAITSGNSDHRYPRINNRGDIVWQERVNGTWQVFRKMLGQSGFPVTVAEPGYVEAQSPAIADDGSCLCTRSRTNSGIAGEMVLTSVLRYPSPVVALTNPTPSFVFQASDQRNNTRTGHFFDGGPQASISGDGKAIYSSSHTQIGLSDSWFWSYLLASDRGMVSLDDQWHGNYPDLNADGHFLFCYGSQIYLDNRPVLSGQSANINDAPRDNPDIVYANGSTLYSTIFGQLVQGTPNELAGTWVDVNRDGILVFEKQVSGYYQVFKAYPWEVRIVSRGGTNGIVGLPYRYDGDNVAEAYGAPEDSIEDTREFFPLNWSVVSGPPGFTVEPSTGRIQWIPSAPGDYTVVLRVDTMDPYGYYTEDTQTLRIAVVQSTVEVVDAVDFRAPGTPDLPTTVTNFTSGGTPRIGVLADGASRLLLRVRLLGADTNSFPSLHFAVAGTNAARDGLLRPITGSAWSADVPGAIATLNGTNVALCLYEAPLDFDAASQPVRVHLLNGTNVIAVQSLLLRRPPVVLVHDGWSGPEGWPLLISQLLDAGFDVYPVDYAFTSGGTFNANESRIFLKNLEALGAVRQAGFAASRVDLMGHGTGGILARLQAQRYAAQDYNYRKGDVHKLLTLGTPHAGSWLVGLLAQLRTNSPSVWTNLRSAVLAASEASGRYPAIDLDAGLLTNSAPGSSALAELDVLPVPAHAIATGTDTLPPGDLYGFIQFFLGLTNGSGTGILPAASDGFVTLGSAQGGIATNAFTFLPTGWVAGSATNGIPHSLQPFDTRVTSLIVDLLKEPVVAASSRFAFFPANAALTNPPPTVVPATNIGNWLVLSGATNGQTLTAGQTVTLTATATGGHVLSVLQFLTPTGAVSTTATPFEMAFQIPAAAVGRLLLTAAARDAAGETAWASVALNVLPGATLLSLQVEPSPVVIMTKEDFPLRVWGIYNDGSQRDVTSASTGTKYRSPDLLKLVVLSNGVVRIRDWGLSSSLMVSVTNGTIWTNVQVTVALSNLPPTAYIAADRTNGPAPFDVRFNATASRGGNGSLSCLWTFDDGTTATGQMPARQRFLVPGSHLVQLAVTDSVGLKAAATASVTVEPWLLMIESSLTLTQRLRYSAVIVTNGGDLVATNGLDCGNATVGPGSLTLARRSTATSLLLSSGQATALDGLDGGAWAITNGTLTLGCPCASSSLALGSNGLVTTAALVPLDLTVSNVVIGPGGVVSVQGKGYVGGVSGDPNGKGPGGGKGSGGWNQNGGGGGYGGVGGDQYGAQPGGVYGAFENPLDFGSGGGLGYYSSGDSGGAGGGALRLQADRLRVDGLIDASGLYGTFSGGSGSGGSVNLKVGQLLGVGTIRSTGGIGWTTGGGGRVAVTYEDKGGFTGRIEAEAGHYYATAAGGGAGTIYLKAAGSAQGELVIDNGGYESHGWSTPLPVDLPVALLRLTLGGAVRLDVSNGLTVLEQTIVTGTNFLRAAAASILGDLAMVSSNQLTLAGTVAFREVVISNGAWLAFSGPGAAVSMVVGSNGVVTTAALVPLDLTASNLVVGAGGVISVQGRGYVGGVSGDANGKGPGGGKGSGGWNQNGGGGGYGGVGGDQYGAQPGGVYGAFENPSDFGSGGGLGYYSSGDSGGAGGGALRLQADRLRVDGLIDASGLSGTFSGGSGSGGSVSLKVGQLLGVGAIRSSGGIGWTTGGGGRVAVTYEDKGGFTGRIEAEAGHYYATAAGGGAGTIYLKAAGSAQGELVIDNGGYESHGWSTPLQSAMPLVLKRLIVGGGARLDVSNVLTVSEQTVVTGTNYLRVVGDSTLGDMVISNRAGLVLNGACGAMSLTLGSGGMLTVPAQVPLALNVSGRILVASNAVIDGVGKGYGPGQGPGAGESGSSLGNGGSYGGVGYGAAATNVYGSYWDPHELGSGGGGLGGIQNGGAGGGAVRLQAQQLHNDGLIAADGLPGQGSLYSFSGDGSGGSVAITVGQLTGSGTIRADGGWFALGGGGGRVAIVYGDKAEYAGKVRAAGGWTGGAGTVYWKKNGDLYGELVVDNGGMQTTGWSTPVQSALPLILERLTVGGSARLDVSSVLTVREQTVVTGTNYLRVASGSVLGNLVLSPSNQLNVVGTPAFGAVVVSNAALLLLDGAVTATSLTVGSNGVVTAVPMAPLEVTVGGLLRVSPGGVMDATGKGYGPGQGPGAGQSDGSNGNGGSYGGVGYGAAATNVYGSFWDPHELGSGGGSQDGGGGGGAVRLRAQQLHNDGLIAADGLLGRGALYSFSGDGSGGSVAITVGQLTGRGTICADGGWFAHGGGGGRVAIMYGDKAGYGGIVRAAGGWTGGAGTVYWKQDSDPYGELVVDNGGKQTTGWSTPIWFDGRAWLSSWSILGNARVSSTNMVRVLNGDPAGFQNLINSGYLQVGGLIVSNTWVYGDFVLLEMDLFQGQPLVRLIGRPDRSFVLLGTQDLQAWTPVASNSPLGSVWEYLVPDAARSGHRFYRAQQIPRLLQILNLTLNPGNGQVQLLLSSPTGQTNAIQASPDLAHWTWLGTNVTTSNSFLFMDPTPAANSQRFYRAVRLGQ